MTTDELILTHLLQCSRSELYFKKSILTLQQQQQFESYKRRYQQGEPLQYILGVAPFMDLELKVTPAVLIPRPETEVLVDLAIKKLSFPHALSGNLESVPPIKTFGGDRIINILDIGTGSGNIAIMLAKHFPAAHITSIDISLDALTIAKDNAQKYGLEKRIDFIYKDIAQFASSTKYDLIISNPPYISLFQMNQLPKDVQQEPRLALEAGVDGLDFYKSITKMTPGLLRSGAYLMMEFGDGQELAVKELVLQQQVFSNIQIIQDLAGRNRIICAQRM